MKAMSNQLQQERYWREQEIREKLKLLGVHRDKLERYCTIITLQREIETLSVTIMALQLSQGVTCWMCKRSCRSFNCRNRRFVVN